MKVGKHLTVEGAIRSRITTSLIRRKGVADNDDTSLFDVESLRLLNLLPSGELLIKTNIGVWRAKPSKLTRKECEIIISFLNNNENPTAKILGTNHDVIFDSPKDIEDYKKLLKSGYRPHKKKDYIHSKPANRSGWTVRIPLDGPGAICNYLIEELETHIRTRLSYSVSEEGLKTFTKIEAVNVKLYSHNKRIFVAHQAEDNYPEVWGGHPSEMSLDGMCRVIAFLLLNLKNPCTKCNSRPGILYDEVGVPVEKRYQPNRDLIQEAYELVHHREGKPQEDRVEKPKEVELPPYNDEKYLDIYPPVRYRLLLVVEPTSDDPTVSLVSKRIFNCLENLHKDGLIVKKIAVSEEHDSQSNIGSPF